LLGSYNYLLNWLHYGAILGPVSVSADHTALQGVSPSVFKSNVARLVYHLSSPLGLPDPLLNLLQPWRALVGEELFSLFNVELNPPGANYMSSTFSFDKDVEEVLPQAKAWYGPLGFLLLLPTLFFYLVIAPFTQKDIWKWLTALASFSYMVIFAVVILWQPHLGRMFLIGVTLAMPLTAGFYGWTEKHKWLRWSVLVVAVTVLAWTSTHSYYKPLFGSWTIWRADYYDLRTHHRPEGKFFRYLDSILPEKSRLGLAVTDTTGLPEYLFFGPNLTRQVTYLGPVPTHVDRQLFVDYHLDYLLLAQDDLLPLDSIAPLWPVGVVYDQYWFMVKREEVELFTAQPRQAAVFQTAYGDDYAAYVNIKALLQKETNNFRVLTTDPKWLVMIWIRNLCLPCPRVLMTWSVSPTWLSPLLPVRITTD